MSVCVDAGRFGASFFTAPISLAGQAFGAQYLYAFYWAFYALFGAALLAHRPQTVGETFFSLALAVLGLAIAVGLVAEVVNLLRVMVPLPSPPHAWLTRVGRASRALDGGAAAAQL